MLREGDINLVKKNCQLFIGAVSILKIHFLCERNNLRSSIFAIFIYPKQLHETNKIILFSLFPKDFEQLEV